MLEMDELMFKIENIDETLKEFCTTLNSKNNILYIEDLTSS